MLTRMAERLNCCIVEVQVTTVACPRNQQDPTAVLRDEGAGFVLMGVIEDGGQVAGQNDVGLAAFRPLSNLYPIDQRSDDVHGLRARRVVG